MVCRVCLPLIGFIARLFPWLKRRKLQSVSLGKCFRKYIRNMPRYYERKGLWSFLSAIVPTMPRGKRKRKQARYVYFLYDGNPSLMCLNCLFLEVVQYLKSWHVISFREPVFFFKKRVRYAITFNLHTIETFEKNKIWPFSWIR